jgi:protein ImuA
MPALVSSIEKSNRPAPVLPAAVWHASQMGSYQAAVIPTSYQALDQELPNGGWPSATVIELLVQQAGIGEIRLLRPALRSIASQRRIVLLRPPYLPQIAAWTGWGMPADSLLWIKAARSADALWSAEQILRNGSCGALLFWESQIRTESLRRLLLAAQGSEMLFWMLRPLACMQQASPAPLRLALRPASGGIDIEIVKRRGPPREHSLYLPLEDSPAAPAFSASSGFCHAYLDQRTPAAAVTRNNPAELV